MSMATTSAEPDSLSFEADEYALAVLRAFEAKVIKDDQVFIEDHKKKQSQALLRKLGDPSYRSMRRRQYIDSFKQRAEAAQIVGPDDGNLILLTADMFFDRLWENILNEVLPFPPVPVQRYKEWAQDSSPNGGRNIVVPRGAGHDWKGLKCVIYFERFLSNYGGRLSLSEISSFDRELYLELKKADKKFPDALESLKIKKNRL